MIRIIYFIALTWLLNIYGFANRFNVLKTNCAVSYMKVNYSCVLQNQNRACLITNGAGLQSSIDGGQTWGSCTVSSCNGGYTSLNNSCQVSNINQGCSILNGSGTQSSTDAGQTWGSCTVSSCDNGYTQSGNTCILNTFTWYANAGVSCSNGCGGSLYCNGVSMGGFGGLGGGQSGLKSCTGSTNPFTIVSCSKGNGSGCFFITAPYH